jgi:ornithine cyclodeaminase
MKVLVLTEADVRELLPMADCVEAMEKVLAALGRGEALQPLRSVLRPEGAAGLMAVMPSWWGGTEPAFGVKLVGVFPGNLARGMDAHQGAVILVSGETGEPRAFVNASAITAIRTAAVSGVATRALANPEAGDLALIGASVQAETHLQAMAVVRHLRRVRVASRDASRAKAFADRHRQGLGCPIEAVASVEEAVRGADLVVTATSSPVPVVQREWVTPGAHLNVIGASLRDKREVDGATVAAATLFVDRRESAQNEAGDYLLALKEGAIGEGHIRAEVGEVLLGQKPGRTRREEITLFKSLGLAVEDLAAAARVFERARSAGRGQLVDF